MPMWIRDASGSDADPRHRTSYLYAKAGAAKSSNVRRALGTVDDRENRNAWVDEGECSVQCVRVVCRWKLAPRSLRERRHRASARFTASRQCRPGRAESITFRTPRIYNPTVNYLDTDTHIVSTTFNHNLPAVLVYANSSIVKEWWVLFFLI